MAKIYGQMEIIGEASSKKPVRQDAHFTGIDSGNDCVNKRRGLLKKFEL